MNKALRILLALFAAPFVPWAVYWVAFAGMNLPYILAGEDAVYIVSSNVVGDFSLFSVMAAFVAVLYWAVKNRSNCHRKPKMKSNRANFALTAALLVLLVGCSSQPEQESATLPTAKNSQDEAQRILQFAAGYCKGMADKHGADFATCFKQQTDLAIAQIEAQAAAQGEQSK